MGTINTCTKNYRPKSSSALSMSLIKKLTAQFFWFHFFAATLHLISPAIFTWRHTIFGIYKYAHNSTQTLNKRTKIRRCLLDSIISRTSITVTQFLLVFDSAYNLHSGHQTHFTTKTAEKEKFQISNFGRFRFSFLSYYE